MNDIEIINKLRLYESVHPVEEYICNDWHVWPLLRVLIWQHFLPLTRSNRQNKIGSKTKKLLRSMPRVKRALQILRKRLWQFLDMWNSCSLNRGIRVNAIENPDAEVLFLTITERRACIGDSFYEIFSDPFADALESFGYKCLIWEFGEGKYPQHRNSVKIIDEFVKEILPYMEPLPEPVWFSGYKKLLLDITGEQVDWFDVSAWIETVTARSIVFEKWMRNTKARYLFVVCWYDPLAMAAIMAAKRCGVCSLEIQHGIQGDGHFAYSSWTKGPKGGFEVLPDRFWCWGEAAANDLPKLNPAFLNHTIAIAGGNLWLNFWRNNAKRCMDKIVSPLGNTTKRILVTLQLEIPLALLEAISNSPKSWLWMIRFHPKRNAIERAKDIEMFNKINHPGLDIEQSNNQLLYSLLCQSDVHLTEYSSCAVEALAFGVPSIILSSSAVGQAGKYAYREFIQKELMFSAFNSAEIIQCINKAKKLDNSSKLITELFATEAETANAFHELMKTDNFRKQDNLPVNY